MVRVTDNTKFKWFVTVGGEKATTIDFAAGHIAIEAGFDLRAGTEGETVLADRIGYHKAWCSLVDKEEPSEILAVFEIYRPAPEGEETYDVVINDKFMPENRPQVEPPPDYEEHLDG